MKVVPPVGHDMDGPLRNKILCEFIDNCITPGGDFPVKCRIKVNKPHILKAFSEKITPRGDGRKRRL
jgi:hypothetical protein